jgi:pyruvate kinase
MPTRYQGPLLERLIDLLTQVREAARRLETERAAALELIPPSYQPSARNLLHYLALRRFDLRPAQFELAQLGLSSLGRAESHVLPSIDAVLLALHRLAERPWSLAEAPTPPFEAESWRTALRLSTERLLGPEPADRDVRILVTMPSEAGGDPALVRELMATGMDVARINAAHDGPEVWERITANVRRAEAETGRPCRILFDLGGPKLRTCSLGEGPRVLRVKPSRDARGEVVAPAIVRLGATGPQLPDGAVPISATLVQEARAGDELAVSDASGRKRRLRVVGRGDGVLTAECDRTVRFEAGRPVRLRRGGETVERGEVGPLPALDRAIDVLPDDELLIVREGVPPRPPSRRADGVLAEPAIVPTTLGEALQQVRAGESIRFDDGKIGGIVEELLPDGFRVRIQHVPPGGARLRGDKGVNLPDSDLAIPCPTEQDLADLDFAAEHADMVGMSFVQRPDDVLRLEDALTARSAQHLGIVLKIETRRAFHNLPALLLTGMRSPPIGVMVARGDLAVEVGFARLAEIQEEILWLCEAAHVPVIWATQVLESLAKSGLPSRAEVSDAAMGVQAEGVMLNKGPFVTEAVRLLDDVLRRMRAHHLKKRSMLRPLSVSWMDDHQV